MEDIFLIITFEIIERRIFFPWSVEGWISIKKKYISNKFQNLDNNIENPIDIRDPHVPSNSLRICSLSTWGRWTHSMQLHTAQFDWQTMFDLEFRFV